jgi:hypothetical protein
LLTRAIGKGGRESHIVKDGRGRAISRGSKILKRRKELNKALYREEEY